MASFPSFVEFNSPSAASPATMAPGSHPSEILALEAKLNHRGVTAFLEVGRFWEKYERTLPTQSPSTTSMSADVASSSASVTPAVNPSKENRRCKNSHSKLHVLKCTHFIFTPSATDCAPNRLAMQNVNPLPVNVQPPDFGCQICVRAAQSNDLALREPGKNWTDLLLEHNYDPGTQSGPLAGLRTCHIAYLARDGTIIPAIEPIDAALIRILWTDRVRLLQRADLEYGPAAVSRAPTGIDSTGFNWDMVPTQPSANAPGGGSRATRDRNRRRREKAKTDRQEAAEAKRAQEAGEKGKGKQRADKNAMDMASPSLDYGDEAITYEEGSEEGEMRAGGLLSPKEKNARRKKREQLKMASENKRKELEEQKKLEEAQQKFRDMALK
ncbi:uncharacterized protein BDZ99DRAFT_477348 [Mytilinidion resinicola]|uniref:Uncharacterized protein n=1 Tax=Mytilinidion resinicola TaxID=574789 RepID=A0A6A6YJV4_9PEZI|nr:uncharacterized protein BDZ99DRAFT_477348 [Mytilinidion resinicola]KAF2808839.1 hypothetical protein BDZ99DRAFT_477348 [Mytilinidion resinicola]